MGSCIQNQKKRYINYLPTKQQQNIAIQYQQTVAKPRQKLDPVRHTVQCEPIQQEEARNGSRQTSSTHETHSAHESLLREVDRRKKPLRRQNYPLNSIGCLYFKNENKGSEFLTEKQYFATGTLISGNIVLTCAHFLDQYRLVGNQNLKFLLASKSNEKFGQALQKSIEVSQYFICKDFRSDKESLQSDYGIAVLRYPIARQHHVSIGIGFALPEAEVSIYGYPYEDLKDSFDMKGMKGPLKEIRQSIVLYDIDTESGQSGSPILLEYAQNLYFVIGMHLGKHNEDDFNSGLLITNSVLEEVHQWQRQSKDKLASMQTGSTGCNTTTFKEKSSVRVVGFNQVQLTWESIFANYKHHQENFEDQVKKMQDVQASPYLPNALQLYEQGKYHQSLCLLQSNMALGGNGKDNKLRAKETSISLYIQGLIYEKLKQIYIAQVYFTVCNKILQTFSKGDTLFIDQCFTRVANIMSLTGRRQQGKLLLQYRRAETESVLYEHEKKLQAATDLIQKGHYQEAVELLEVLKGNQLQHSSVPSESKALLFYRLSSAYLALKRYSEWVENISACLWIIGALKVESMPEGSKWHSYFVKLAFDLRKTLDFGVKCRIGRAFKLLNNLLGFDMSYYCS